MNIPDQFVHSNHVFLSTIAFSVFISGELEEFFLSTRGLRQGCALSQYLFVITINILSRLLNRAASSGNIGYYPTCSEVNLTHLSYHSFHQWRYGISSRNFYTTGSVQASIWSHYKPSKIFNLHGR